GDEKPHAARARPRGLKSILAFVALTFISILLGKVVDKLLEPHDAVKLEHEQSAFFKSVSDFTPLALIERYVFALGLQSEPIQLPRPSSFLCPGSTFLPPPRPECS